MIRDLDAQRLAPPQLPIGAVLAGVREVAWTADALHVTVSDIGAVALDAAQLYDDAPVRFDDVSGQRRAAAVSRSARALLSVAVDANALRLEIDGESIAYPFDEIVARAQPHGRATRRRRWSGGHLVRRESAAAFMEHPEARRRTLTALLRDGVAVIEGLAPGIDLGDVAGFFGQIRATNFGRTFEVRSRANADTLAATMEALAPHTDNPYRATPPDIQVLACRAAAAEGGETVIVDGLAVVEALRRAAPDMVATLATTPVRFAWESAGVALEACAPVIAFGVGGDIERLRVNDRALREVLGDPAQRQIWRAAYRALQDLIAEGAYTVRLTLRPGDVLLLDNRTILHGRTAFTDEERWLEGCYVDIDGAVSACTLLERAVAKTYAEEALALLAGPRGAETYGESVTLRAHALQCATLAAQRGLRDEAIAAALLHDIGWAWDPQTHETSGADFAAARFGDAVGEPIRLHVAAKRFLVAAEPGYAATLSEASRATLVMQGGPMSAQERAAFLSHPFAPSALLLRHLDDAAKDAAAISPPLDAFRALLERCALAAMTQENHPR